MTAGSDIRKSLTGSIRPPGFFTLIFLEPKLCWILKLLSTAFQIISILVWFCFNLHSILTGTFYINMLLFIPTNSYTQVDFLFFLFPLQNNLCHSSNLHCHRIHCIRRWVGRGGGLEVVSDGGRGGSRAEVQAGGAVNSIKRLGVNMYWSGTPHIKLE